MKGVDRNSSRPLLLELDRDDEGKALAGRHRVLAMCCTPLAVIRQSFRRHTTDDRAVSISDVVYMTIENITGWRIYDTKCE